MPVVGGAPSPVPSLSLVAWLFSLPDHDLVTFRILSWWRLPLPQLFLCEHISRGIPSERRCAKHATSESYRSAGRHNYESSADALLTTTLPPTTL